MFDSGLIDVAIDLAATYLLLSVVCSTLNEWFAAMIAQRATTLESGIKTMLSDQMFAQSVLGNPLVKNFAGNLKKPSYIPSQSFSLSLIAALVQPMSAPPAAVGAPPLAPTPGMNNILQAVNAQQDTALRNSLLALLDDAHLDYDKFRANLEQWFNNEMDRVSGWYKRWSQAVLLVLAAALVVIGNVDTIRVVRVLWGDSALRGAIATSIATDYSKSGGSAANLKQVASALDATNLPIGSVRRPPRLRDVRNAAAGDREFNK